MASSASKKKPAEKPAKSKKPVAKGARSFTSDDIGDVINAMRKACDNEENSALLASTGNLDIKIRGVISTRCASLDDAIGRGGIPLGRITILHGGQGVCKTTTALQCAAECQSMGGIAVYEDSEWKLDLDYAAALGVDTDRMIMARPKYLEQSFAIQETVIKMAAEKRERYGRRVPILYIKDSLNASLTKAQVDAAWEQQFMGAQARGYSALMPKLQPLVATEDVAMLYISQVRKKMNVTFGNDEEIAGGNAPAFYASLIIHVKRIGTLKDGEMAVGSNILATCTKNQIAPPFRKCNFIVTYGKGVDNERAIVELAVEKNVINKNGAWFSFGEERIGQGAANVADYLRAHPDTLESIRVALKERNELSIQGSADDLETPKKKSKKERKAEEEAASQPAKKSKLNMSKMASLTA